MGEKAETLMGFVSEERARHAAMRASVNGFGFRLSERERRIVAAFGKPQLFINMGFDKDDTRPVVDVTRRTTKVNIWMIVAVVTFFIVAGIVVWVLSNNPSAANDVMPAP